LLAVPVLASPVAASVSAPGGTKVVVSATGEPAWCGPLVTFVVWSAAQPKAPKNKSKLVRQLLVVGRATAKAAKIKGLPSETSTWLRTAATMNLKIAKHHGAISKADKEMARHLVQTRINGLKPAFIQCTATLKAAGF
jgi:2,4-dienoyl-CoA reductase-like NADH-dependent reductase (Old Yellow Enzyme family)